MGRPLAIISVQPTTLELLKVEFLKPYYYTAFGSYVTMCLLTILCRVFVRHGGSVVSSVSGVSQVRIPLQPPRTDLGQVLHSQLPVVLQCVDSDTVSML